MKIRKKRLFSPEKRAKNRLQKLTVELAGILNKISLDVKTLTTLREYFLTMAGNCQTMLDRLEERGREVIE